MLLAIIFFNVGFGHQCHYRGSAPPIEDCELDKAAKKWMFNANSGECFSFITCSDKGWGTKESCDEHCATLRIIIQGGDTTDHHHHTTHHSGHHHTSHTLTTHAPKRVVETTTEETTTTTRTTSEQTTVEQTTVRAPPAEKENWKSEYNNKVEQEVAATARVETLQEVVAEENEDSKKRCHAVPDVKLGILNTDLNALGHCINKGAGDRCPLTCKQGYEPSREQPWSDFLCVDGAWMQYAECVEIGKQNEDSSLRSILIFLLGGTFVLVIFALIGHLLFDVGNPILPSDLSTRKSQARSFVDAAAQKMSNNDRGNKNSTSFNSNNNMMEEGLSGAAMRASVGSHHHPRIRSRNNYHH